MEHQTTDENTVHEATIEQPRTDQHTIYQAKIESYLATSECTKQKGTMEQSTTDQNTTENMMASHAATDTNFEAAAATGDDKKRAREEYDLGSLDGDSDDSEYWDRRKRPRNAGNMKTLRQLAENAILKSMEKAVSGPQPNALYCCGGSTPSSKEFSKISLRWDCPGEDSTAKKIEFPSRKSNRETFRTDINNFLTAIKTSDGVGTMDRAQFSIDIDPYSQGIVDVISKSLFQASKGLQQEKNPTQFSVGVELSTLHVRTIGSRSMQLPLKTAQSKNIGKLVLCLPSPHRGGELKISHEGHSTTFDWTKPFAYPYGVQWAAFFRECEHEFQPVSKGYQVILNYNIYMEHRSNLLLTKYTSPMDATVFPLYEGVRMALELPFMKDGGTLGFHCQHSYNFPEDVKQIHHELLGVDRAIYSVFRALGLTVQLRPLLDLSPLEYMEEMEYDMYLDYREYRDYDGDSEDDICEGCGGSCCRPSFEEWKAKRPKFDAIGTSFRPMMKTTTDLDAAYGREEKEMDLKHQWKFNKREDITWLNEFKDVDKTRASLAVVNTQELDDEFPDIEYFYSHPVILVTIPKILDRDIKNVLNAALKKHF